MDLSRTRRFALLAAVAAVLAGAMFAATAEAKIERCNGQKVLCNQPFNEVVLAGAHNAMSTPSLGWLLPNQSIAIPDQLRFGIRGFLVDTYYGVQGEDGIVTNSNADNPDARTYFCHVYCQLGSSRLAPMLRQIRKFLRNRPNNVLLIDNEDYQRGVWLLRMARANGLDTADSAFSLARGLVQTKRADEARAVLKPVLEKGSPADKAKAEALLKQI